MTPAHRTLMEQALAAMLVGTDEKYHEAINALQAALAEDALQEIADLGKAQEVKPVFFANESLRVAFAQWDLDAFDDDTRSKYSVPLFTHPAPRQPLTENEISDHQPNLAALNLSQVLKPM